MSQTELESKSIKELKAIALQTGIRPNGDTRKKSTWIDAISQNFVESPLPSLPVQSPEEPEEDGPKLSQSSPSPVQGEKVMAITLHQPWATLVALRIKDCETRSWGTNYRGRLLIHAAQHSIDQSGRNLLRELRSMGFVLPLECEFPYGAIVAEVELVQCRQMITADREYNQETHVHVNLFSRVERLVGDFTDKRFAWELENVKPLLIPDVKGFQKLWKFNLPPIRTSEPLQKLSHVSLLVNVRVQFDEGFENAQQIHDIARTYSGASWFSGLTPNYQEENYSFGTLNQAIEFIKQARSLSFVYKAFSDRISSKLPLTQAEQQEVIQLLNQAALCSV